MDPEAIRIRLLEQHEELRQELGRCRTLAHRLRNGEAEPAELDAALARLRVDFAEHNTSETSLVRPLLHGSPGWGAVLIDRMLEEHVGEHAAFWESLAGSAESVAARIEDLSEELEAHMAAEERTFLSPVVLHPEAIQRRRRGEPTSH